MKKEKNNKNNNNKVVKKVDNKVNQLNQKIDKVESEIIDLAKIEKKRMDKLDKQRSKKQMPRQKGSIADYGESLRLPEFTLGARIPGQLAQNTVTLHRHATFSFNTSVVPDVEPPMFNPYFCLGYLPFSLFENGSNKTSLGLNVNGNYNGSTGTGGNFVGYSVNYTITPSTIATYRLVSAAIQVVCTNSVLTQTGKIGGAVIPVPTSASGSSSSWGMNVTVGQPVCTSTALQTISNIDTFDYYAEAQLPKQESLRLVYYPQDIHDYDLYRPDNLGNDASESETLFIVYGSGLNTSATVSFNVEIYANYEVTPAAGSTITGMTTLNSDSTSPTSAVNKLKNNKLNVAMALGTSVNAQAMRKKDF